MGLEYWKKIIEDYLKTTFSLCFHFLWFWFLILSSFLFCIGILTASIPFLKSQPLIYCLHSDILALIVMVSQTATRMEKKWDYLDIVGLK